MIPVIRKIGSYFRKQIGTETGLRGPHKCGLCGEATDPGAREWSPYLRRFVDSNCVPAIVRAHGIPAVSYWLETGDFVAGTGSERSLVLMETGNRKK